MSKATNRYKSIIDTSPTQSDKDHQTPVTASREERISTDPVANAAKQADASGMNFLSSLLHSTIFFDYFEYVANKTYKGDNLELKIVKLKSIHPFFHNVCIVFDSLIMITAVTLLIIAASSAVFKVIFG